MILLHYIFKMREISVKWIKTAAIAIGEERLLSRFKSGLDIGLSDLFP